MIHVERKRLTYYKELADAIMEAGKPQDLCPLHPGESME